MVSLFSVHFTCCTSVSPPLHFCSKVVGGGCGSEHGVTRGVHVDHLTQATACGADNEATHLGHFDFNLKEEMIYCCFFFLQVFKPYCRMVVKQCKLCLMCVSPYCASSPRSVLHWRSSIDGV